MNPSSADNLFALILLGGESAHVGQSPPDIHFVSGSTPAHQADAFAAAARNGCTHLIVLRDDSTTRDGDVAALIDASKLHPSAMILGSRPPPTPGSMRQKLASLVLRLETGKRLAHADGSRVYPVALIDIIGLDRRAEMTDVEAVVRTACSGCKIIDVPLAASPGSSSERSSLRAFALHAKLLARALGGWPHPTYGPRAPRRHRHKVLADLWQWCNPVYAWRELRQGGASRNEMALGIAVGVFIANTPTYGFQLLIALHAARRLHLHPAAVVAGSKASTPPVGPMLIASAIWLGHFVLHGSVLKWANLSTLHRTLFKIAGPLLLDWCVGATIIGTATAVIAFFVASFLFRFVQRKEHGLAARATKEQTADSSTPVVQS